MTRGDESGREERTKADKKYKEETFNTYTIFHLVSVTQFKHPPQPHSSYPFVLVIVPHLKYFPAARSVVNEGKTQTSKSETISFDVERISRFIFQRFSAETSFEKNVMQASRNSHCIYLGNCFQSVAHWNFRKFRKNLESIKDAKGNLWNILNIFTKTPRVNCLLCFLSQFLTFECLSLTFSGLTYLQENRVNYSFKYKTNAVNQSQPTITKSTCFNGWKAWRNGRHEK